METLVIILGSSCVLLIAVSTMFFAWYKQYRDAYYDSMDQRSELLDIAKRANNVSIDVYNSVNSRLEILHDISITIASKTNELIDQTNGIVIEFKKFISLASTDSKKKGNNKSDIGKSKPSGGKSDIDTFIKKNNAIRDKRVSKGKDEPTAPQSSSPSLTL